jgi:hypothetical protein
MKDELLENYQIVHNQLQQTLKAFENIDNTSIEKKFGNKLFKAWQNLVDLSINIERRIEELEIKNYKD